MQGAGEVGPLLDAVGVAYHVSLHGRVGHGSLGIVAARATRQKGGQKQTLL